MYYVVMKKINTSWVQNDVYEKKISEIKLIKILIINYELGLFTLTQDILMIF
jgi:hypothetical protein